MYQPPWPRGPLFGVFATDIEALSFVAVIDRDDLEVRRCAIEVRRDDTAGELVQEAAGCEPWELR